MNSVMDILLSVAKNHATQEGCLEIQNTKESIAEFYFQQGHIYAALIRGVAPPFAKRASWSVHQSLHSTEAKEIIRTHDAREAPGILIDENIVDEQTIKSLVRDFFLATTEDILYTWKVEKEPTWIPDKILDNKLRGLQVVPITPEKLEETIDKRASSIDSFVKWLEIEKYELNYLYIQTRLGSPAISHVRDADNLVYTLSHEGTNFLNIIKESGWMGTSALVKSIYRLYQKKSITIHFQDRELTPHYGPEEVEIFPPVKKRHVEEKEPDEFSDTSFEVPDGWFQDSTHVGVDAPSGEPAVAYQITPPPLPSRPLMNHSATPSSPLTPGDFENIDERDVEDLISRIENVQQKLSSQLAYYTRERDKYQGMVNSLEERLQHMEQGMQAFTDIKKGMQRHR